MKRKRLWGCRLLGIILMTFWLPAHSWGMAGKEHFSLWNQVFGISDVTSQKAVEPLWKAAQRVIDSMNFDDTGSDYQKLRRQFPWFSWGRYGHRLLFHWGFNGDPWHHPPIRLQVRNCLKQKKQKNPQFDSQDQEKKFFSYLITTIQKTRNRELIDAVQRTLGISTARGYANAVATIIYDVHLLGDYSTPQSAALPRLDTIETDLIKHGFDRLLIGGDKTERLQKIDDDLRTAIRLGRGRNNQKRAELLLEATARCLPQILNERFKRTLGDRGISLTLEPQR